MIPWLILSLTVALAMSLYCLGLTRYGQLRLSEMAGFLFILLAGPRYRRHAAGILAARQRRAGCQDAAALRQDLESQRAALDAQRQLGEAVSRAAHETSLLLGGLERACGDKARARYPLENRATVAAARERITIRHDLCNAGIHVYTCGEPCCVACGEKRH
jgi:hypothetical protein